MDIKIWENRPDALQVGESGENTRYAHCRREEAWARTAIEGAETLTFVNLIIIVYKKGKNHAATWHKQRGRSLNLLLLLLFLHFLFYYFILFHFLTLVTSIFMYYMI